MKARLLVAILFALALGLTAQAAPGPFRAPKGLKFRPLALTREVTASRGDQGGVQDQKTPSKLECRATGDPSANVNLDCDGILPNDEPHIAVNPTNPNHMVASSND